MDKELFFFYQCKYAVCSEVDIRKAYEHIQGTFSLLNLWLEK